MSWVTIIWSMGASACLTLAAIYFLAWLNNRSTPAPLAFAITAAATAVYAFFELRILTATTPQSLDAALRWVQLPLSAALIALMWFVAIYLDAGRRWLLWTIVGLRAAYILPSLLFGGNPSLTGIETIERIQFLGESVTLAKGVSNPLALVGSLTGLLMLIFVGAAGARAWQRGERRRAVTVAGGAALFLLAGVTSGTLMIWAGAELPAANSLYFQGLVVVMGSELSRDLLRAAQLADDLRISRARSLAILKAVPDLMFLQSSDGVFMDYHAPHPAMLFAPPEQFLGRNVRDVLPAVVLRELEPAFQRAGTEPTVVEYELPMADGHRHYEARLVRNADAQILTLVRDVTAAHQAQAALRESEAVLQASHRQVRELAGHLIESQEVERARLARDLHDDLSQQIAGLSIALSGFKRRLSAAPLDASLPEEVAAIQRRAVELADNVRHLSHDLHPSVLVHAGLVAALSSHCAEVKRTQPVAVSFTSSGEFLSVPAATALCLYRVTQEALRNVVTHAAAAHVNVRLVRDGDQVELTIADDGKGFAIDPARRGRGLGLVSINERARLCGGTVSILTELNQGTRVRLQVPLAEPVVSLGAR